MGIYPAIKYDDPKSAIDFLTSAFGLVAGEIGMAEDGSVGHAELSWDGGVVMIITRAGPPGEFDTGRTLLDLPVDDVDAHYRHAARAGAEMAHSPIDQPYGSREYAARDPEGNVWSFGTYRPVS